MILVHNHPSGDAAPSSEDLAVTKNLEEAGKHLAIPVLDHIIVAREDVGSVREEGSKRSVIRPGDGSMGRQNEFKFVHRMRNGTSSVLRMTIRKFRAISFSREINANFLEFGRTTAVW